MTDPQALAYREITMTRPNTFVRCDSCFANMSAPELVRVYVRQESNGVPVWVEHTKHPIKRGALPQDA